MPQTTKHPQFNKYFLLYCVSTACYGVNLIGLGALIPYLTEQTGVI